MRTSDVELIAVLAARLAAIEDYIGFLSKQEGPAGRDGKDGIDGVDGLPGIDGVHGLNGLNGKDGIDGQDGAQGPRGPKGDKGDTGPKGDKGDTGPAPDHRWVDKALQFKKPNGRWGQLVDLGGSQTVVVSSGSAGSSGTDLNTLPAGDPATVPEEIAVKQNGVWVRIAWVDFLQLLTVPNGVTVDGMTVTVNGTPVTATLTD